MGRHSSDSGQPNESPLLSKRRKRRRTRGERDKLLQKNKCSDASHLKEHSRKETEDKLLQKKKCSDTLHGKEHSRKDTKNKTRTKSTRKILKSLKLPMIKQDVPTITQSRLTRRIGLFDKMKSSETIVRDNIRLPDSTVKKTKNDLQKILDLGDQGLQRPIDIQKLNCKRLKITTIRAESEDGSRVPGRKEVKNKSSKAKTQPMFSISSDSSVDLNEDMAPMEVDQPSPTKYSAHYLPEEPDFAAITENVRDALLAKNYFGERDLAQEIRSRLRTMFKASSPSLSAEMTPQQKIPAASGSLSSEIVKRDSSRDEASKSDSELHGSTQNSRKKSQVSDSSFEFRKRIKLNSSNREGSQNQHEETLPLTHTIPRITVDALSDARHLLHLNDHAHAIAEQDNERRVSEPGYMESRMKAYGVRRALASITNVVDTHRDASQIKNLWAAKQGRIKPAVHIQDRSSPSRHSYYDPLDAHTSAGMTRSWDVQLNSTSVGHHLHSANISSNQNAVAQYAYPALYQGHRQRLEGATHKYYEDPRHLYQSSQESFKSVDTLRSRQNDEARYMEVDDTFPGCYREQRHVDPMDLLDVADISPGNCAVRYVSPRKRAKLRMKTPSPPTIYPFRLFSKGDQ